MLTIKLRFGLTLLLRHRHLGVPVRREIQRIYHVK